MNVPEGDLEAKFNARVIELLNAAREHAPFLAVRNVVPPREGEALRWVRNVLAAPHPSDATDELCAAGYAALTMESLVLDARWSALFTPAECAVARARLGIAPLVAEPADARADLEARLTGRILGILDAALRDARYDAVRLRALVDARGGVETARSVLAQPGLAGGLAELVAAGRPDLSIEALLVDGVFDTLFAPEELAAARERLGR